MFFQKHFLIHLRRQALSKSKSLPFQELDVSTIEPLREVEEHTSEEESEDEEGLAMAKVFDDFVDSEDDSEYVEKLQEASEEEEDDDAKSESEKLAERKAKVDQYILKIGEPFERSALFK